MEIKNVYYHIVVLRIMGLFKKIFAAFLLPLLQTVAEDRKGRKAGLEPKP